jgi:hypothetical protein
VSQLVTVHNTGYGLAIDTMDDGLFINNLVVGNNAAGNCNVIGTGVNPGIDGACVSSATVTMGANLASTFLGGAATQSYGSITNWNLAQREQVYGRDAASTTSIGARGRCTTGTCRLWDYGLAPSDTVLRGVMYTPGQACPSEIAGGEELSGAQEQCFDMFGYPQVSCPRASLVNGMELLDDHVGNDDGFCESGERCEFLPHLSNARGRGPELAPCIFQDGTGADVVGVTIIGHTD